MTLQQSSSLLKALEIAAKIFEKDPKTLVEVIRLVEKLSVTHQLTAIITPSTVSMMPGGDGIFVSGQTSHFGHHHPDDQCYGCDAF